MSGIGFVFGSLDENDHKWHTKTGRKGGRENKFCRHIFEGKRLDLNFIGNIIWLVFGGFLAAVGYFFGGLVLCLTVVGIPWGLQCFKIAGLVLWPFGKRVVSDTSGAGCLSLFCNFIWLLSGGLYTACIHIVFGILLFLTVIGIPFARQHFKLVEISLMPFGKTVVY